MRRSSDVSQSLNLTLPLVHRSIASLAESDGVSEPFAQASTTLCDVLKTSPAARAGTPLSERNSANSRAAFDSPGAFIDGQGSDRARDVQAEICTPLSRRGNNRYHSDSMATEPSLLLAVTMLLRSWIDDWRTREQLSYAKIGQRLGVSKTHVQNLYKDPAHHRVGKELEIKMAELAAGGSVDRLRRMALTYIGVATDDSTMSDTDAERRREAARLLREDGFANAEELAEAVEVESLEAHVVDQSVLQWAEILRHRIKLTRLLSSGPGRQLRLPGNDMNPALSLAYVAAELNKMDLVGVREVITRYGADAALTTEQWFSRFQLANNRKLTTSAPPPKTPAARGARKKRR